MNKYLLSAIKVWILSAVLLLNEANDNNVSAELTDDEKAGNEFITDQRKAEELYLIYRDEVMQPKGVPGISKFPENGLCNNANLRERSCDRILTLPDYFEKMQIVPDSSRKPTNCEERILSIHLVDEEQRKGHPAHISQHCFSCPIIYQGYGQDYVHVSPDGIQMNDGFVFFENVDVPHHQLIPQGRAIVLAYFPRIYDLLKNIPPSVRPKKRRNDINMTRVTMNGIPLVEEKTKRCISVRRS